MKVFLTIISFVVFYNIVPSVGIYEKSVVLGFESNSTNITTKNDIQSLSKNNTLLKLYEIEKQVKLGIQNLPVNINYSIGHLQKAGKLVDPNFENELESLEPRIFNQIENQISDLKIIVNNTKIPKLVKGAQISEGLSHIVDLVQLLQVDKIENDTKISENIPYLFSLLNNDILISYNNSKIWLNNQTVIQTNNHTKDVNQLNTINNSKQTRTLEYQTAQDYSAGILDFMDNLNYLKPDAFTYYNITKLKNDYTILNQLINNKTDIIEIKKFNFQNFQIIK